MAKRLAERRCAHGGDQRAAEGQSRVSRVGIQPVATACGRRRPLAGSHCAAARPRRRRHCRNATHRAAWCALAIRHDTRRHCGVCGDRRCDPAVSVSDRYDRHHWTKSLLASVDGERSYVGVGSNRNAGENGLENETDLARRIGQGSGTQLHHGRARRRPIMDGHTAIAERISTRV